MMRSDRLRKIGREFKVIVCFNSFIFLSVGLP